MHKCIFWYFACCAIIYDNNLVCMYVKSFSKDMADNLSVYLDIYIFRYTFIYIYI